MRKVVKQGWWIWLFDEELNCYCAAHNPSIRADKDLVVFGGGGGSETTIVQPKAPEPPSATESMNEYIKSLPKLYETQMEYSPLIAAQQVGLAQEYAGQYGQAMRDAQMGIAPETTALQEELAGKARTGMDEGMPDWMKEQYRSDLAANMGSNIGSPIAADYMSMVC